MSNIYLNTEQQSMPPTDNQIEGCHGHFVSINAGGRGHSYGDSCGCDGINPETSIDFIAPLLMLSALIIIIRKKINLKLPTSRKWNNKMKQTIKLVKLVIMQNETVKIFQEAEKPIYKTLNEIIIKEKF